MTKKTILLALIFFTAPSCYGGAVKRYVFSQPLMYTQFDIILYSSLPERAVQKEAEKVWKELDYWFIELSPAGLGSAARLNKEAFFSEVDNPKAYAALSNFVARAKRINAQSKGAFDLTVYPLVRLWGFYKQDTNRLPTDAEIKEALKTVGMDKVSIESNGIRLMKGARLDYGAIAKGFAVDVAVTMLSNVKGIHGGIVNAGGNLRVFGNKPDQSDWTVGVRDPNGGEIQEVVPLYNGESIATSGDYEQYFIGTNGKYYHHIFDPLTGRPVEHNLASVSVVVQDSAETADMLSTTFLASGREKTLSLIKELGIEKTVSLYFIERNGKTLTTFANENWLRRKEALENSKTP